MPDGNQEVNGQEFAVEHAPEEALQAPKQAATDPLQETFAALMPDLRRGQCDRHAGNAEDISAAARFGQGLSAAGRDASRQSREEYQLWTRQPTASS